MKTKALLWIWITFMGLYACRAETDNKKSLSFETPHSVSKTVNKNYIKVALLLDTSNSMDGLIDQAKAQLWNIVNELSYAKCDGDLPSLQIGLYEYGNDNLNAREGYLRKILPFTEDLDEVSKELFSLTTNGGSEYCGTVIKASLEKLDWGTNADDLKMIFIAGNEPFTQGNVHYKDAASEAKEKGVIVNTIFCGDYSHGIESKWKEGATLTYGDYSAIDHDHKTIYTPSPYDELILQLNIRLNNTYVPYGSYGKRKMEVQASQDENAATYSKANAVSRTVTKGSHLYKNSTWDLVDAETEEDFNYTTLENDKLPEELKEMSTSELKKHITNQRKKRTEIQTEIQKLNEKRRIFLSNTTTEASDGLGNAMLRALKKQAEKKNYSWD
ncbi:vWA domain-containing protein [Cochleicola gelatinilyticus]|uniref:VWFA domain-containing protein n=1 Tax=Cochleicola gelatinilyticus TaxID=1763537 RepID=A0A167KC84_9FLAO|nr:vWA domain-containing protein [Cochleicola gelatinilyticus]OAB81717.1 hypothetical protein ULVI_00585 [Cochleicola gelatinilyticus]